MKNPYKKIGIVILISLAVITIIIFILNFIIERKIENTINELPSNFKVEYGSIDSNVWSGNLKLSSEF